MNEEKLKELLKLAWDAGSEECLDTYYGRDTETFQEWYTKQKLNIHGVSGKRPTAIYLESIKQDALDKYDNIKKPRSIYQDGYRDGFIDGADLIVQAAGVCSGSDKTT